jgi:hypothetical protein
VAASTGGPGQVKEERKRFFFEKKQQKTSNNLGVLTPELP